MKSLVSFAFATALVTFATAKTTFHSPIEGIEAKRAYLTCQESYGDGSITCGDANSLYCYNPTLGEVYPASSTTPCGTDFPMSVMANIIQS
jgi:hypothetical protein